MKSNILFLLGFVLLLSNCTRDLSDDAEIATFPKNGEVFIDGFSAGLEYLPFGDSYFAAFSVDTETRYAGTSAMRFDIPNVGDPDGAYAGAIFPDYGRRDLSGFDALTFWAKATKKGTINQIGFGQDFRENKYQVTLNNLELTTNWRQYTIAIPDPSKLTQESGLFWYAEGPEDDEGYTFWVDEVRFEKLGTIAQPRPAIFEGADASIQTFAGVMTPVSGLTQTLNLGDGQDQTLTVAPSYFEFTSSDPSVATVTGQGMIMAVGSGEAVITATLGGVEAKGSATVTVIGDFVGAPTPTQDPSDVISIFSDAYTNQPVDYYNGYWAEGQTTQGQDDININGDNIIAYTDLNFVGIQFAADVPTINASAMTHFHIDVQPREDVEPGDFLTIRVVDIGPDNAFGGGDDSSGEIRLDNSNLVNGEWYSVDVALSSLAGLARRSNLAQIVFVSDATISNIFVDNIYFYDDGSTGPTGPTVAAPTPTQGQADVVSLFSNAYSNVTVDTWSAEWDQAEVADVQIAGDDVKLYTGLNFAGIEFLSETVDASMMERFHMDIWTPDPTAAPAVFRVKLVDLGADNAIGTGDDVEHEITLDATTTPALASGTWVGIDVPLSAFTNLATRGNLGQLIISGDPNTVYVDNIYFYGGGGMTPTEPTVAAPTPTEDEADVISMFSDAYTDVPVDTWRTDWSQGMLEDITVQGNATKKYSMLNFIGVETLGSPIDATDMTHFRLDVWSPDFTQFRVKLVDLGADNTIGTGDDVEHEVTYSNPTRGSWISYDIPLSDFTNLTTRGNIGQLILAGQPEGAFTVYVDNVYFYGDGGAMPTEPPVAAPTPTENAANVISMFSDAYTDVPVDTWRTDWSQGMLEDVMIAGNAAKKYSEVVFVGIETLGSPIDATGMTHFHIDVWSADFTEFWVKLVDLGADNTIGGGDDVEHEVMFIGPAQGEWISYEIPLSDFTNLVTRGSIGQLIISGRPEFANTFWIDNVYFSQQ